MSIPDFGNEKTHVNKTNVRANANARYANLALNALEEVDKNKDRAAIFGGGGSETLARADLKKREGENRSGRVAVPAELAKPEADETPGPLSQRDLGSQVYVEA